MPFEVEEVFIIKDKGRTADDLVWVRLSDDTVIYLGTDSPYHFWIEREFAPESIRQEVFHKAIETILWFERPEITPAQSLQRFRLMLSKRDDVHEGWIFVKGEKLRAHISTGDLSLDTRKALHHLGWDSDDAIVVDAGSTTKTELRKRKIGNPAF